MNNSPIRCKEIAIRTGATLVGDGERIISRVADLESATAEDISFFANLRYKKAFLDSSAGAIFCSKEALPSPLNPQKTFLVTDSPSAAFQKMVDYFHPHANKLTGFTGIHPTAVIHPTARIEEGVEIGPYCIIDEGAHIGSGSCLLAHVTLGPYALIGQNCLLYPQTVVREGCRLGNRVILQPGAVIGSCGFGYATNKEGHHQKLAQVGIVVLEDDVEIGANTTVDRARFNETIIKRGTKIDNLVQIGHGVEVGEDCFIVALSGIAGSSKLGRHCTLAAQSGVSGHLTLADNVTIAAKAGVSKSLKAGVYNGTPAVPVEEYNRTQVYIRKLSSLFKKEE